MFGFKLSAQQPPEARRVSDTVVQRFEGVFEVDPELMQEFPQQDLLAWDTHRIVDSRWDHLDWMHRHFAHKVIGMEDLGLDEHGEPRS